MREGRKWICLQWSKIQFFRFPGSPQSRAASPGPDKEPSNRANYYYSWLRLRDGRLTLLEKLRGRALTSPDLPVWVWVMSTCGGFGTVHCYKMILWKLEMSIFDIVWLNWQNPCIITSKHTVICNLHWVFIAQFNVFNAWECKAE